MFCTFSSFLVQIFWVCVMKCQSVLIVEAKSLKVSAWKMQREKNRMGERERGFSGLLQAGVSEILLDSDLEVYLS